MDVPFLSRLLCGKLIRAPVIDLDAVSKGYHAEQTPIPRARTAPGSEPREGIAAIKFLGNSADLYNGLQSNYAFVPLESWLGARARARTIISRSSGGGGSGGGTSRTFLPSSPPPSRARAGGHFHSEVANRGRGDK